eukprot:15058870-Alexandrium_andersonii.AAC.1
MSASLVGSEMCIRDRSNPSRPAFGLYSNSPGWRWLSGLMLLAPRRMPSILASLTAALLGNAGTANIGRVG